MFGSRESSLTLASQVCSRSFCNRGGYGALFYIINDTYFSLPRPQLIFTILHRKMPRGIEKKRKYSIFLGFSILICWTIFAKKSGKLDALVYTSPSKQSTPVLIKPYTKFENLHLDGSKAKLCAQGKLSPSGHCLQKLRKKQSCDWWEEISSYLQISEKNYSYYKHLAQRPCKSKPKLLMKEFPEPKCTKSSYLHQSDTLLCDSWNAIERNTGVLQRLWYQQVGTWEVFRQTYYNSKGHRNECGKTLCEFGNSLNNKRILEYGSGIAPFSSYMLKNCPKNINAISIVDVPAEHYYFALWSLRYKLDFFVGETASLRGYEIGEEKISFPESSFDIIIAITVFEHLPNPYAVAQTLLESLEEGGLVYEDFCADELHSGETSELISKDTSDPNLGVARIQRGETIALFDEKCSLLFGDYGTCSKRLWKC